MAKISPKKYNLTILTILETKTKELKNQKKLLVNTIDKETALNQITTTTIIS